MSWVAVGLAVGGGLLSAYQSGRKTDAQAKQLESQRQELLIRERETRAQAVRQKSLAYQSAYQSQVFGDLEQSRITRLQHFNTQKQVASLGSSGAMLGSGTPYNVILAQKAENSTNTALHQFKVQTEVTNRKGACDRAFDDLNRQADGIGRQAENAYRQKLNVQSKRSENMFMSFLTGGMSGSSTAMQISSYGKQAGWFDPSPAPSWQTNLQQTQSSTAGVTGRTPY